MKNRRLIKALCLVLAVLCFAAVPVSAGGSYSYIYNSEERAVEAPVAAEPERVIDTNGTSAGALNAPQDLCITPDGTLYIADTGNDRIVVLTADGGFTGVISSFLLDGQEETFQRPTGVFINANGELYICDSMNARIVVLDAAGQLVMTVEQPSADILTEDFSFKPVKVAADSVGRIFVVSEGFNLGLLEFDHNGEFVQYMGASEVALSLRELFWRTFSTKAQREKSARSVPTEYNNLTVDSKGFIMVTTAAYEYWRFAAGKVNPLRRLNAKGEDVLVRVGNPSGDRQFTAPNANTSYTGPSALVDICALENGSYAALDQNRGRVFVYSSDGEMYFEFGGPGEYTGGFTTPAALANSGDRFYILDTARNSVTVYRLTEYGRLFTQIAKAQQEIDYTAEKELWQQVLSRNGNCELAIRGLGMAAYREQDMHEAMEYFKQANDKEYYSKAFVFVRRAWIENHPVQFSLLAVGLIALIFVILRLKKAVLGRAAKDSLIAAIGYSEQVCFHPMAGFWDLKKEKRGSVGAAFCLLAAACVITVLSAVATGFIFNANRLQEYNLFTDVAILCGALMLWCICQWCVAVLMEGEGRFRDIFIASCYSLTPYIWLTAAAIVCSRVLTRNESEFHTVLVTLAYLLTIFLLVISVKQIHDFSMGRALVVIAITLVAMLLILFVLLLLIALLQQMYAFVGDLYNEILMRF